MAKISDLFTPGWSTSAPGDMKNSMGLPQIDRTIKIKKPELFNVNQIKQMKSELLNPAWRAIDDPDTGKVVNNDLPLTSDDAW